MTHDTKSVDSGPERSNPTRARRQLRQMAAKVRREQLHEALERLEAQDQLTVEQRQILEEMSTAIVDEVLKGPEGKLVADGEGREDRIETVVDLFDCGEFQRS